MTLRAPLVVLAFAICLSVGVSARSPGLAQQQGGDLPAALIIGDSISNGYVQKPQEAPGKKVKVFILAGQSNMEGKAQVKLLEHQINAPETKDFFAHLHNDGEWVVRDDVWINFLDRRGNLTVGFGSPNRIGPELEFGNVIGNHFEEKVLLIKTAWGGKSIGKDFRSPSSGMPGLDVLEADLEKINADNKKNRRPQIGMEDVEATYGHFYREMVNEVRTTLAEIDQHFPDYAGEGYEIAGLVWFQGWNDMFNEDYKKNYATNLANLIRDVRKELKLPNLPVVVGVMGQNGFKPATGNMLQIRQAQESMATIAEFKGNVAVVQTDVFWDEAADKLIATWRENKEAWEKVGSDYAYHYLGSAITFTKIGRAFGEAMLELMEQ